MKRIIRSVGVAACGVMLLLSLTAVAGAADTTKRCTGTLAAGMYQRVVVPAGAACFGEGPVTIRAGLFIEPGATFVLGSEDRPVSTGTIGGGVHATNPASVQIHFATINGGVSIHGGSGPFGGPFDVTWNAIEDTRSTAAWSSKATTASGSGSFATT